MAPTKTKKMVSDQKIKPRMATKVPIRDSPSTPQRSPIKRRKVGITLQQKQTLIENLQLEGMLKYSTELYGWLTKNQSRNALAD